VPKRFLRRGGGWAGGAFRLAIQRVSGGSPIFPPSPRSSGAENRDAAANPTDEPALQTSDADYRGEAQARHLPETAHLVSRGKGLACASPELAGFKSPEGCSLNDKRDICVKQIRPLPFCHQNASLSQFLDES